MNPLENVLSRLDGIKRSGRGYVARCPAHNDQSPSLSVTESDDGRALIHCFAGCSVADVVAAIGLELKDLFPASNLTPIQRAVIATSRQRQKYLDILRQERTAVQIGRNRIAKGETLSPENQQRFELALGRVKKLEAMLND